MRLSGLALVSLDGSGSKDAEGIIVAYIWTEASGKGAPKEIARGANPTINLEVGGHNLMLTVYDTDGYSATDTVTITVTR